MDDIDIPYTPDQIAKIIKAYEAKKLHIKGVNERAIPCKKAWVDKNKDYYKGYNKAYFEEHRHDKAHCDVCNVSVSKYCFARHKMSKRHIAKEGVF